MDNASARVKLQGLPPSLPHKAPVAGSCIYIHTHIQKDVNVDIDTHVHIDMDIEIKT